MKKIPQELGIRDLKFYSVLAKNLDIDEKTVLKYVYSAFPQNYTSKNFQFFIDAVEATVLTFITDEGNFNRNSIEIRWKEKKDSLLSPFFEKSNL